MRRIVLTLAGLAAMVLTLQAHAQEEESAQPAQVSIVEPNFRPAQEWTYTPNDLTVPVGTTITWTNTGVVAHTVTADDGASFDSGSLDPQASFSLTTDTPGTFAYHCSFHPWMTGTFTVTS